MRSQRRERYLLGFFHGGIIAHGADAPFYIEKRTMSCATALVAAVIR